MKSSKPIFIDNKSKTGILMLHGFTSTPEQLREAVHFACKYGFNVSVPLIAGHGTCPDDLMKSSAEDWKKSAKDAYLQLKKISEKVFIIGNSFGSNLAFWLAKEFNNEPAGIVSIATPIYLRYHPLILLRLYTYGLLKKYYHKPIKPFKMDEIQPEDVVVYPVIPTKSLRDFFNFIKKETIPNLNKVRTPIFICHSSKDMLVHPKSARHIFENIGSAVKEMYWFDSCEHVITHHQRIGDLFEKIYEFIKKNV